MVGAWATASPRWCTLLGPAGAIERRRVGPWSAPVAAGGEAFVEAEVVFGPARARVEADAIAIGSETVPLEPPVVVEEGQSLRHLITVWASG
jgi:hypothetical protein